LIFNTWSFAVFGSLAWIVYWTAIPQRYKPHFLVLAGGIFYAFSVPAYLVLITLLAVITFMTGRAMLVTENRTLERTLLMAGIVAIAGTLVTFKYSPFFASTVDQIAAHNVVPIPRIIVPLAISFFTFEFVHVLVDIRLRKIGKLDPLEFAVFTFFFPTLVAGPIKRCATSIAWSSASLRRSF
jgi:alginate O-acetyltransferase complex protein AlgI